MGKLIQPLMIVAAVAVNVIPGVGQVLSAAMITAITAAGVSAGLSLAAGVLGLGPKAPHPSPAQQSRLNADVDVTTPRKIVFGETALSVDIRHQEWSPIVVSGDPDIEQGTLWRVFFHASHKVHSIDEIWLEEKKAWSKTEGVTSDFKDEAGDHTGSYISVTEREEGNAGNTVTINDGSKWGTNRRCTGLAYSVMSFRVYGFDTKDNPMQSPFSGGVPGRMTVRGRGAPVYDPRQDSTVTGGSGTMRADNQATWAYTGVGGDIGRNPALQILWYLLGWRINGKLALGRGIPKSRIDMASFIIAANACDETVTSTVNGSEPRYRSDGAFSENDDPHLVLDTLKAACNAELRDLGGILSLHVKKNDLASVSVQLNENDLLGGFLWKQTPDVDDTFNEVRGRWTDPSDISLYQLRDYPPVRLDPVDGIERNDPFDLPTVQSVSQAQRLAKQRLARNLYRGVFSGDFNARAWKASLGKIVELSLPALGWANKKFRVIEMGIRVDGVVPLTLLEEHSDIYLWDNSDAPAVQPFVPTYYDPSLAPIRHVIDGIEPGATRNVWRGEWTPNTAYLAGDLVTWDGWVYECTVAHTSVVGQPPPNANWVVWFATGTMDGISAQLTRPGVTIPATWDGYVDPADFAGAAGEWLIYAGTTDVTDEFLPITTAPGGNPGTLDTNYVGRGYAVTGSFDPEDDYADLTMRVEGTGSFVGVTFDRTFRLTKVRTPLPADLDPPPTPSGLTLSSTLATAPTGEQVATLHANWTPSPATDLAYYRLFVREAGGNFVQFIVGGASWSGPAIAGRTYEARVQAVDASGNVSGTFPTPPAVVSHTVAGDNVPPATPISPSASATFQNVFLNWTNAADADLVAVEVWEHTAATGTPATVATKIATVPAETNGIGTYTRPLATGQTRYYWLRSVDSSGNTSAFTAALPATTAKIDATNELIAGSVTTNLITVGTLNGDRIQAASIVASKLVVAADPTENALPQGITIGVSGTTLGTVDLRAADPIGQANTRTTKLAPGLIVISGSTTLADWRSGYDQTKIDGGELMANSVSSNKIQIGNRGLSIAGLEFEHNSPSANRISWTSGSIDYTNDANANVSTAIAAGSSAVWASGTIYVYWVQGATTLSTTTSLATANQWNQVILATYRGGTNMVANYGRTIIDGSDIKTGTVTANQMSAGLIITSAAQIGTAVIQTAHLGDAIITTAKIGDAQVNSLKIGGASVIVPTVSVGADTFVPDTGAEVTVMTSGVVTVGDAFYGSALVEMQGNWDGTLDVDAYAQVFLDLAVNGGAYIRNAQCTMGCRVGSGSGFPYLPFKMGYVLGGSGGSAVSTVQGKMVAKSVQLGGASSRNSSYIRQPKIIIQGGKR